MKKIILILALIICSSLEGNAQTFEIPKDYTFKVIEDFAKYEKDILPCIYWLESTPINADTLKRFAAENFFLQWVMGTPNLSLSMNAEFISQYIKNNPEFFTLFLAGWAKYSLEHKYSKDPIKGHYEGLKSIINVYRKGLSVKNNEEMDKLVKVFDAGGLEQLVRNSIKQ